MDACTAAVFVEAQIFQSATASLEHPIRIGGGFGDGLAYVPMFDDLAVLEPENLHDRQSQFVGLKLDVDMEYHEVAVGEDALDLAPGVGKLLLAQGDERLEALDTVGRTERARDASVISLPSLC